MYEKNAEHGERWRTGVGKKYMKGYWGRTERERAG